MSNDDSGEDCNANIAEGYETDDRIFHKGAMKQLTNPGLLTIEIVRESSTNSYSAKLIGESERVLAQRYGCLNTSIAVEVAEALKDGYLAAYLDSTG